MLDCCAVVFVTFAFLLRFRFSFFFFSYQIILFSPTEIRNLNSAQKSKLKRREDIKKVKINSEMPHLIKLKK